MSDKTPILITLSEICACAPPAPKAAASATASAACFIVFMRSSLSDWDYISNAEILVQLGHVPIELGIGDHVGHAAVVHQVMTVGDRRRKPEVLLDQQDREA